MFGPTNFISRLLLLPLLLLYRHGTARMKISDEDFYGGRTGPLEKFYLFIYFLLMISDEDFYGGRTWPLEKFYLFILFFC